MAQPFKPRYTLTLDTARLALLGRPFAAAHRDEQARARAGRWLAAEVRQQGRCSVAVLSAEAPSEARIESVTADREGREERNDRPELLARLDAWLASHSEAAETARAAAEQAELDRQAEADARAEAARAAQEQAELDRQADELAATPTEPPPPAPPTEADELAPVATDLTPAPTAES